MANEMFGAPVGIEIAERQRLDSALAEMSLAKGSVELEVARTKLDQNKRMLQLMSQGSQSPSSQSFDMAEKMSMLAEMALKSGMPEEARQYAEAGATLRRTTSQIDNVQFTQKMKHLELLSNLMAGVNSQQSWAQANALFKMQTGKDTPFAQQPYSPQLVSQLQRGFMTAKDKALTDAATARQRASEAATRERTARLPLIRAQTEVTRARTKALEKTGAVQKIPKAGEVKLIKDLIGKEYRVMPEEAGVLAQPIAERMLEILKTSNITRSEAANRAFQEAKSGGHFGGLRPVMRMKGTLENPMDIPKTRDGKADSTKLRANMYYKGVGKYEGKVFLWNGKTFQEPPAATPESTDALEEEETEDEENETEDARESETGGLYDPEDYLNPDTYSPEDYEGAQ